MNVNAAKLVMNKVENDVEVFRERELEFNMFRCIYAEM